MSKMNFSEVVSKIKNLSSNGDEKFSYFKGGKESLPFAREIILSKESGPLVILVGGTHGNEPVGVDTIVTLSFLVKERILNLTKGSLIGILGNPEGYKSQSRYVEEDLNRAFGKKENTKESLRAQEITEFLKKVSAENPEREKYILDIHSVSKGDFRIFIYHADDSKMKDTAAKISALPIQFIYTSEVLNGLLIDAARAEGFSGFGIECGNHTADSALLVGLLHVQNLLLHLGMIDEKFCGKECESLEKKSEEIRRYKTVSLIKPHKNFRFLNENVVSEYPVAEGEIFAEDEAMVHKAVCSGFIMMPSKETKETDHDAGFFCVKV